MKKASTAWNLQKWLSSPARQRSRCTDAVSYTHLDVYKRQLLSIARAAVADPPVMILDEATSSIDTRTESIVQAGMDGLMSVSYTHLQPPGWTAC